MTSERIACVTDDFAKSQRQTILIVGPPNAAPDCLVHAIEREFPNCAVERTPDLLSATRVSDTPTCLILIESGLLGEIEKNIGAIRRNRGDAPLALLQDGSRAAHSLNDILVLDNIRGVLPMDMRLDVWLQVLRLMLGGGQYFPAELFHTQPATRLQQNEIREEKVRELPAINALTERELEVLAFVARGQQNKTIAASLGLSEYTVKIHVHHIMTKLGTHNRTGAAAIYHARPKSHDPAPSGRRHARATQ